MKLIIVGGVAAGASAAARARRLDEKADIIVFERGPYVSFANCGLPYHIGGVIQDRARLLVQTPESLRAALNLDVRVSHEVTSIDRQAKKVKGKNIETGQVFEESYDKLVLCPGARPARPNLPGMDHPRIFTLRDMVDMDRIKECAKGARTAVVIGAGYVGVEVAENFLHAGMTVDVVEMLDQVMPPLDPEMAHDLEEHMIQKGLRLHLGTSATRFEDRGGRVLVCLKDGNDLEADLVIMSVGVQPDSGLARDAGLQVGARGGIQVDSHLRTSDPDIYAAGDAIEVNHAVTGELGQIPLAGPANRQGRIVADNIFGRQSECPSTQGTAIVKVFDMTAGSTGASEKVLKRMGIAYRKVHLHPNNHAAYYPGSSMMHLKILFSPDSGKVLGGQVVGFDGVDKRVDVLAMAIKAGMTVYDLENVELSYAPPYGSAKDAINMAGFVASNLLRGDIEIWYPEDHPDKTKDGVILDVRSLEEFDAKHIPGAINIPLAKMRKSLGNLPKDKTIHVYCKVGIRSYLAYRILKQSGFQKVLALSGGILTFSSQKGEHSPLVSAPASQHAGKSPKQEGKSMSEQVVSLDCSGLQCPGPILKLTEAMSGLNPGDVLHVSASDPGFSKDVAAWCQKRGHELVDLSVSGPKIDARIRKGNPMPVGSQAASGPKSDKKTMVVFSGDLDKALASFIIANGAKGMGSDVVMFFTFWGLNILRKKGPQASGKSFLDKMFGFMMPKGPTALKLSKMNMMGMGTAMMKHVMKSKRVDTLASLIESAQKSGVKLVACAMSLDVMGLKKEELIDGVEIGGVAAFLSESDDAGMTLFI